MAEILLVDDDEPLRRVMAQMLVSARHTVREAEHGKAAIAQMRQRAADVIISDVYMPEMDGLETLMRLKHEFPAAKLIAMSGGGYVAAGDVLELTARLGACATLQKPVSAADLLAAVEKALG